MIHLEKDRDGITDTQKFGNMPFLMKYLMIFIDRVGFPVLAFCIMSYICFTSLDKLTDALSENTKVLTALSGEIKHHHEWAVQAVDRMERNKNK